MLMEGGWLAKKIPFLFLLEGGKKWLFLLTKILKKRF